jgi:hypothetical protein
MHMTVVMCIADVQVFLFSDLLQRNSPIADVQETCYRRERDLLQT